MLIVALSSLLHQKCVFSFAEVSGLCFGWGRSFSGSLMCPGSSFWWSGFGGNELVQLGTAQLPLSKSAAFCCPGVFGENLCLLTLQVNSYFVLVFFNLLFSPFVFPVGHCFCLILYIHKNYSYNLRNIYRSIHKVLLQFCSVIGGLRVI